MMSELGWTGQPSDNLTTLTQLTEHTLLEALKQRYLGNHIYTDVGDILVAINPFQQLPIYTESWSQAYSQPDVSLLAPHIFKVASRAYSAMLSERKDQVCVISGESGAGKTESAKLIMRQVMIVQFVTHSCSLLTSPLTQVIYGFLCTRELMVLLVLEWRRELCAHPVRASDLLL